jgi:hypothetical protein
MQTIRETRVSQFRGLWATLLVGVACLFAFKAVALGQTDPRVGTWVLNLAKSTFSPGPAPQKQILTFQAAGPHWTALLQGLDAS